MSQTTIQIGTGITTRMTSWIGRFPQNLSARIHTTADERARIRGWQVTETTGPFGLGGRRYRDPRFDDRRRQLSRSAVQDLQRHHSADLSEEVRVER